MKPLGCRLFPGKSSETMTIISTTFFAVVFGFFLGVSLPKFLNYRSSHIPFNDLMDIKDNSNLTTLTSSNHSWSSVNCSRSSINLSLERNETLQRQVPAKPRGAERLPPGIIESESDFYLRRLWGKPSEDLTIKEKYLVVFTVGYDQKRNIDAGVKKFSNNFTIMLFHYDGRTTEWDEFEWSKRAIHVSAKKQTKWWFAKRFLHPDIVAAYDYIFIWDEDLGLDNFDAEEYIKLVRKHRLEISQPGLQVNKKFQWPMTKRRKDHEVHKEAADNSKECKKDPHTPPCAAFVEIMAPVFSREAWRCVWHMLQNDLVHGWGIDFALRRCVEPAHEKIGVVDAQWIVHQGIPSLGNQGIEKNGKTPKQMVRERCLDEWQMFRDRLTAADKSYDNGVSS